MARKNNRAKRPLIAIGGFSSSVQKKLKKEDPVDEGVDILLQ